MKWTSYISGPRWAGFRRFLYDAIAETGVDLINIDVDNGLLRQTIYYTVEGDKKNISALADLIEHSVKKYNT